MKDKKIHKHPPSATQGQHYEDNIHHGQQARSDQNPSCVEHLTRHQPTPQSSAKHNSTCQNKSALVPHRASASGRSTFDAFWVKGNHLTFIHQRRHASLSDAMETYHGTTWPHTIIIPSHIHRVGSWISYSYTTLMYVPTT